MIKIILIVGIFSLTMLVSDEIFWVGCATHIGVDNKSWKDKNESREVDSNSSLDVNLSSFVWK